MINLRINNSNILVSNLGLTDDQITTRLVDDYASGSASINVASIQGISVGKIILIGNFGDSTSEIIRIHTVTAPSVQTITLASNTTKDHYSDTPVTILDFDQIEFSRSTTLSGSKSVLATQSINSDRIDSLYKDLTNTTGYAFARFKNSYTSSYSSYSTGVNYSSSDVSILNNILKQACNDASVEVGGQYSTEQMLIDDANDCQDTITNFDWKFELVRNDTSLSAIQYENTYSLNSLTYELKYPAISQGIKSVKFGSTPLQLIDNNEMDDLLKSVVRTTVATQAGIGDTSIVVTNSNELNSTGTVYINGLSISYTSKDDTTNTISGISAATITSIIPVDSIVWQNISLGIPTKYTISIENELILDRPISSTYAGFPINVEYLKKLTRFTDFSSTTEVPFVDVFTLFVSAKIEKRKRNFENYQLIMKEFNDAITLRLGTYKMPILDNMRYYEFFDSGTQTQND
jgi:hypothetical protein